MILIGGLSNLRLSIIYITYQQQWEVARVAGAYMGEPSAHAVHVVLGGEKAVISHYINVRILHLYTRGRWL